MNIKKCQNIEKILIFFYQIHVKKMLKIISFWAFFRNYFCVVSYYATQKHINDILFFRLGENYEIANYFQINLAHPVHK